MDRPDPDQPNPDLLDLDVDTPPNPMFRFNAQAMAWTAALIGVGGVIQRVSEGLLRS